jgi:hypothetical protein
MDYNNDFKYDLKIGQLGERHISNILSNKKIEVKTDFKALNTGNVFVEYESRNKKSGISTSEAEFYCFIISNEQLIIIETKLLKKKCRYYLKTKRDVIGGDLNTSKGILLPITELIKNTID